MIAVKIPAAIRDCSPVVCVSEPYVGSDVVGSRGVVKSTEDGEVNVNGWWTPRACWALVISDPTGAAHLAWWLASPRLTQAQHDATLEALGIGGYNFLQILGLARVGDVAKIDARGLEILRDYAHRVAGVTNG